MKIVGLVGEIQIDFWLAGAAAVEGAEGRCGFHDTQARNSSSVARVEGVCQMRLGP